MSLPQNPFPGLPDKIYEAMCCALNMEFATMTARGVPLDTPTFGIVNPSGRSFDCATGLAYPAKAERARRNPKVGLLFEGPPGSPVVSVSALAAVRDSDIQANVDRYIAETGAYTSAALAYGKPWSVLREAVWYWTRIIILNTPVRIRWWASSADLDQPPQSCEAPAGFPYPVSDPAPAAPPAPSSSWPLREWRDLATEMIDLGIGGHLTLADGEGFPLPFRATKAALVEDGFDLEIPAGAPWRPEGSASLSFMGSATFIGAAAKAGNRVHFKVERALPVLPMVRNPVELFAPSPGVRASLMDRLQQELARRDEKLPSVPAELPPLTPGGALREAQFAIFEAETKLREAALER